MTAVENFICPLLRAVRYEAQNEQTWCFVEMLDFLILLNKKVPNKESNEDLQNLKTVEAMKTFSIDVFDCIPMK